VGEALVRKFAWVGFLWDELAMETSDVFIGSVLVFEIRTSEIDRKLKFLVNPLVYREHISVVQVECLSFPRRHALKLVPGT